MSAAPQALLPREFKIATWVGLVVAGLVGFKASADAMAAISPVDVEELLRNAPNLGDAHARQVVEVVLRTHHEIVQSMRGLTATVLLGLSFVCGLVVVSAIRLLYPAGLPRGGMRRITGGALLVAGVLRTIDGAMQLVIARRTAERIEKLALPSEVPNLEPGAVYAGAVVLGPVILTVLVVAALVGAAQYLRSERARQIVETVDAATARP